MARAHGKLVVGVALGVVVLGLLGRPVLGREVKLVICPQKAPAEAGKYVLLPPAASLTDEDAAALYDKAVKLLPGKAAAEQVQQYLQMPIDKLPQDQAEQVLKQYLESLRCAAQAVKCRQCNWSAGESEEEEAASAKKYRELAYGIRLWARLEVSRGEYEGAILALQTGFGMARRLGQTPSAMGFLHGIAVAAVMLPEVEQWVQMADAPNLYAAFAALPKPLVDAEKCIEGETGATSSQLPAKTKARYDPLLVLGKRLERDLAVLQSVEAIRSYAASHNGQLPQTLAEITETSVPTDPISQAAFRYTRTGATAVLESPAPPGGQKKQELRYEIAVKN
jgi:tetratricopeptide (TPR) repeat protein